MKSFLESIRYYLSIYQRFVATSVAEALSFRTNFLLLILVDIFFYASTVWTVVFLFDHTDRIGMWGKEEFLFFTWLTLSINQLHMSFFAMSFWEFSRDLREGRLDFWLLKPASPIFSVFFRHVRVASACLMPVPWTGMIVYGMKIGLTPAEWIVLPFLILIGITILISLEILISTVMFWTIEGLGVNFVRMQVQSLSRWPDFVYPFFFQKIFTFVVPVLLVSSGPSHLLIGTRPYGLLITMFGVTAVLWLLISFFWGLGVKNYESASS